MNRLATSALSSLRNKNPLLRYHSYVQRYTKQHQWIRYNPKTNSARLGITYYAQKKLGDITRLELPSIGETFDQNQEVGEIESDYYSLYVFSPLSGQVLEVNDELIRDPSLINKDSESQWVVKIELEDKGELCDLLTRSEYNEMIGVESDEDPELEVIEAQEQIKLAHKAC